VYFKFNYIIRKCSSFTFTKNDFIVKQLITFVFGDYEVFEDLYFNIVSETKTH